MPMCVYTCRSVVLALVSHPQWPKAMRHTFEYEGKETTPFRHMIRTMPGMGATCRMDTHFADSALHGTTHHVFLSIRGRKSDTG